MMTAKNDLDPITSTLSATEFQLERLRIHLHWIHEHALSVENEALRENLVDAATQAQNHLTRLKELVSQKSDCSTGNHKWSKFRYARCKNKNIYLDKVGDIGIVELSSRYCLVLDCTAVELKAHKRGTQRNE